MNGVHVGRERKRPPPRQAFGELMAEETPSRELLENLVERIDQLERILQAQTARLYAVEQTLGLEPRTRTRPFGVDDARREETAPPEPRQASHSAHEQRTADAADAGTQQT